MMRKVLFVFIGIILLFHSCSDKEEDFAITKVVDKEKFDVNAKKISLGRKFRLAYSIDNMQAVYDSLKEMSGLKSVNQLEPTHYYVRFLPKDTTEFDLLLSDTSLVLFSTPFDYEVEGAGGEEYHDPSLPDNQITWQYTSVPIDYEFPNVKYEILDRLYISPDFDLSNDDDGCIYDDSDSYSALKSAMSFSRKLQIEAFARVGCDIKVGETGKSLKGILSFLDPTWTPKACIYAKEDLLGKSIPLKGVRVYICHGGAIACRTTNADGYVKFPKCIGPVLYKIEWADKYWRIYDGIPGLPVFYSGPTKRSNWLLNITGGQSLHYACIHRGCYLHFYDENFGIYRPVNRVKNAVIPHKICYKMAMGSGQYCSDYSAFTSNIAPDIKVYGKNSKGQYKTTYSVFKTMVHELGHASHCLYVDRAKYMFVDDNVTDAWAVAVAWKLCSEKYKRLGATDKQIKEFEAFIAYQDWPNNDDSQYSPLLLDLIDDYNQYSKDKKQGNGLFDNIEGYSLPTLQKYLMDVYTFKGLKNKLLSSPRPANVSYDELKTYLSNYEKYW
ncbi:MAG: hypothetical protein K6G31_05350 [Paludibacteraceae bacterium]|nr:hypothetical protein [Paludibacteraceae bacterium]